MFLLLCFINLFVWFLPNHRNGCSAIVYFYWFFFYLFIFLFCCQGLFKVFLKINSISEYFLSILIYRHTKKLTKNKQYISFITDRIYSELEHSLWPTSWNLFLNSPLSQTLTFYTPHYHKYALFKYSTCTHTHTKNTKKTDWPAYASQVQVLNGPPSQVLDFWKPIITQTPAFFSTQCHKYSLSAHPPITNIRFLVSPLALNSH